MRHSLLAFVDLKDPFMPGEIAEEPLPGPVLSVVAARPFTDVFLFHTPHTAENAQATVREVQARHPGCNATLIPLPVADPKDYSAVMGTLARQVRRVVAGLPGADLSVCVSSGTAEMRAAWFLLHAAKVLRVARLLQVGSPAEPLYGPNSVTEVSLDADDWSGLRDLMMPMDFSAAPLAPGPMAGRKALRQRTEEAAASLAPPGEAGGEEMPEPHPGLEEALRELNFHVHSPKMHLLTERAAIVAGVEDATLIHGATCTGKDLVARLIHRLSPRRGKPMVTVNCGAIPEELAESHLFGHVRGSFTGAVMDREGLFEAADRGTLFLDEVAELTRGCQAKLLRAVQFGEFARVGSTRTRHVDVRVIAATHRKLAEEVAMGTFRDDLFQRLGILPLEVPPLRERPAEIVPLAMALLKDINARRQQPRQLSKDALRVWNFMHGLVTCGSWTRCSGARWHLRGGRCFTGRTS